jgi:hypothetical protein
VRFVAGERVLARTTHEDYVQDVHAKNGGVLLEEVKK